MKKGWNSEGKVKRFVLSVCGNNATLRKTLNRFLHHPTKFTGSVTQILTYVRRTGESRRPRWVFGEVQNCYRNPHILILRVR